MCVTGPYIEPRAGEGSSHGATRPDPAAAVVPEAGRSGLVAWETWDFDAAFFLYPHLSVPDNKARFCWNVS